MAQSNVGKIAAYNRYSNSQFNLIYPSLPQGKKKSAINIKTYATDWIL